MSDIKFTYKPPQLRQPYQPVWVERFFKFQIVLACVILLGMIALTVVASIYLLPILDGLTNPPG